MRKYKGNQQMSNDYLIMNCSPTLAGLKTGNMFNVKGLACANAKDELRKLNKVLTARGLRAVPLRYGNNSTLIYIYRPDYLQRDLSSPEAASILREKGYVHGTVEKYIAQLACRICSDGTFPHEVGLFLGYPPSDVKGFMKDPKGGKPCVGYWRVYENLEEAKKTFAKFRKCTEMYIKQLEKGRPLETLIVSGVCPA